MVLCSLPLWKGDHTQNKLGMGPRLCCVLYHGWELCGNIPNGPGQGASLFPGTSLGTIYFSGKDKAWKPSLSPLSSGRKEKKFLFTQWFRLKNEAQGLISLEPWIKFTFMSLRWGILSKAFLIAQLQLQLTKVNNYLYFSLKIRPYMKNGNQSSFLLFIYFGSKYHSKENTKLNRILPNIYFPRRA